MTIAIEQIAYRAGRDYLLREQNVSPSSYIFQLFRKSVGQREKSFNDRYRNALVDYRKAHLPSSTDSNTAFFYYGQNECSFLDELLRRELAGSYEHTGAVSFSLTRKISFYPEISQMEFTDRWIQMCLIGTSDKNTWEEPLTAFYHTGKHKTEQPIFCQRTALLDKFLESNENDSCPHRFAQMVVKTLREHKGALLSEVLDSSPDIKKIAALDSEAQKVLSERLFCELYLASFEHYEKNLPAMATLEHLKEEILVLQFIKIKGIFLSSVCGIEDPEVFANILVDLLSEAKQNVWIQKAKLQRQIDAIGQQMMNMFQTARSAGLEHRDEYADLIIYRRNYEKILFSPLSEKAAEQLKKIKHYAELSLLLINALPQMLVDPALTKSNHVLKKLRSLTSPRAKSKNDTNEVLSEIKRLNLSDGAEETPTISTPALYQLIETLEIIESYKLLMEQETL